MERARGSNHVQRANRNHRVILFIGLALAGALILGDDFRSATSSTKAATLMSNIRGTLIA